MKIGVKKRMVRVLEYNPEWKNEYLREKSILSSILKGYDVDIRHVGSTAIVGCKAKPIIDIAIGVPSLEYGKKLIPILQSISYYYDGRNDFGVRYFLKKCENNIETHFIHIEDKNSRIWQNHIVFRDYMNSNPEKVVEYSNLKENLAEKFRDDRKSYTKSKDIYIKRVIKEVLEELGLEPKGQDYNM